MRQRNSANGFLWGVVATLVMSTILVTGYVTGMTPMPKPIPAAVTAALLGGILPAVKPFAVLFHLLYGGVAGAVFVAIANERTVEKALGYGVALWVVMGLVVLPLAGWGLFGTAVTPKIAVATLVLHLVYGTALWAGLTYGPSVGTGRSPPAEA